MSLEYDVSFVRHDDNVAVAKLFGMVHGQKALIKLGNGRESIDIERLDRYLGKVRECLGESSKNYSFILGLKNGKYGLVIKKV